MKGVVCASATITRAITRAITRRAGVRAVSARASISTGIGEAVLRTRIMIFLALFFMVYYVLTEPARTGDFLVWVWDQLLHAAGRLAVLVNSL